MSQEDEWFGCTVSSLALLFGPLVVNGVVCRRIPSIKMGLGVSLVFF